MLRNRRNLSAVPARARRNQSTGGEVANALVCKTSIRGFNSRPVLQRISSASISRKSSQTSTYLFTSRLSPGFPIIFSGLAEVCEWYDDDAQCFRIRVDVSNPRWGKLFGYTGSFQCEKIVPLPPSSVLPVRVEKRE